ncbi:MAG: ribbon-helix-helix domain-containing protein [Polaromonas sp.]
MIRANLFIPEALLEALRALAKQTDLLVSEYVRRAIAEYLRRQK